MPTLLRKNPMFRLSMSSLELFHSNFLEWLFDIDHKAFLKCFGLKVNNSSTYTIKREYHLGTTKLATGKNKQWVTDIAVFEKADDQNEKKKKAAKTDKNKKLILIIENKIKSTPSKGQLLNQSELANELAQQKTADAANEETDAKSPCKKVLLSLFEYSVSKGKSYGFDKVLYKKLCRKILDNYKSHLPNTYIKDYCDMLERLQFILDNDPLVIDWRGRCYTAHLPSANLETCGIMDAFRKYQAASLVDKFEKRFIKTDPKTGMSLCKKINLPMTCEHSLNHKRACATIAYELNNGTLCVGVQVEQDQLRIFFENKDKNKKIVEAKAQEYWKKWFYPLTPLGKSTKKGGPHYCSYDMSKSLFIYRYVKLGDIFSSSPITINDLCKYVEGILNKIIAEYHSGNIFYVLK